MSDKQVEVEQISEEKAKELLSASLGAFYMLADTLNSVAPLVAALEDVLKRPVNKDDVHITDTGILSDVTTNQEFTAADMAKVAKHEAKEDGDGSDKLNRESDKGTSRPD